MKLKLATALFAAITLVPAANAATTQITGGSGQRALGITFFDPLGQTFTATDTDLQSFGFQINTLNPGSPNSAITFSLLNGAGFNGSVLATRSVTFAGVPATRDPTWIDFDLTGTKLVAGQSYTALLTTTSSRYGLIFGPDINIFTGQALGGDAYAGGSFIATGQNDATCNRGICDANFRFTAVTPAAVPEPATWAMMIGGFGLAGGALRRRATSVTFA